MAPTLLTLTDAITEAFRERGYVADRSIATAVFLALQLGRPLLLEGEAGVLGVVLKYEEDIRQVRGETVKGYLAELAARG